MILNDVYAINTHNDYLANKKNEVSKIISELTGEMCKKISSEVCSCIFDTHKYVVPNESDLKEKIEDLVYNYFLNSTNNIFIFIQREQKSIFDCVNKNGDGFTIDSQEILNRTKVNEQLLTEDFFQEVNPIRNMISKIINHINFRNYEINQSYKGLDIDIKTNIENIIEEQFNKVNEEFDNIKNIIISNLKNEAYQFSSYVYSENESKIIQTDKKSLSMESILNDIQNNKDPFNPNNKENLISQLTEEQKNELAYGKTENESKFVATGKSK